MREGEGAEDAKLQQRLTVPKLDRYEEQQRDSSDDEAGQRPGGAPVGAAFADSVRQHGESDRSEDHAQHVESRRLAGREGGQEAQGDQNGDDADRHVDEEDPRPGDVLDEVARQHRAERRGHQDRDAERAHDGAPALRRRDLEHHGHADRRDHAAAEPLQHAEDDQLLRASGERAERRSGREQGDRSDKHPLGAEFIGHPACERDDRRQRQGIAGHGPLQRVQGGSEVFDKSRESDVHDGRVENDHEHAEDDGQERRDQLLHGEGRRAGRECCGVVSHYSTFFPWKS